MTGNEGAENNTRRKKFHKPSMNQRVRDARLVPGQQRLPINTNSSMLPHDVRVDVSLRGLSGVGGQLDESDAMHDPSSHAEASITTWTLDDRQYFTITFPGISNTGSCSTVPPNPTLSQRPTQAWTSQSSSLDSTSYSVPLLCKSCGSMSLIGQDPAISPGSQRSAEQGDRVIQSITNEEKLLRMRGAMIDGLGIPVMTMWKDKTVAILNKGVYDMMYDDVDFKVTDAAEILAKFKVFTEDFERELDQEEYPIVKLCRTQKPFSKWKVGILDSKSRRRIYHVSGDCVLDEKTGEFQAGMIVLADVTWYTNIIKAQSEQNEQQFQLICETLPQMVSDFNLRLNIRMFIDKILYPSCGLPQ